MTFGAAVKGSGSDPRVTRTEQVQTPRLLFVTHTGEIGGAELVMLDVIRHFGPCSHVLLFSDGPPPL